jgi:hypothetical protein
MRDLVAYLYGLTLPRIVLWCYLIWYLVMAGAYFDPSPRLWLTSAGLSLVIGFALVLSVVCAPRAPRLDRWQTFRLFLIPFCVSSFAALVKDRGFVLIFSPQLAETGLALGLCAAFLSLVALARRLAAQPVRYPE